MLCRVSNIIITIILALLIAGTAFGRLAPGKQDKQFMGRQSAQSPAFCTAAHRIGKLLLAVSNNGTFGTALAPLGENTPDCFTGEKIPAGGCEYPKGSGVKYAFSSAFWIGAVMGRDTLVSQGSDGWEYPDIREFFPDEPPFGNMIKRSIIDPTKPEYNGAVSEEDYIATYTDTFKVLTRADESGRPHKPLYIAITQNSYAWSYEYTEDFVLFDYEIKNIGFRNLHDVFMGIYVDADVCANCNETHGYDDDICGFLPAIQRDYKTCTYLDTVYLAWIADNDGDKIVEETSTPHVTATRIVRTPSPDIDVSFNWWVSNTNPTLDFGPQQRKKIRDFGTGGLGTPVGDANRYYVMSNGEFDYDQVYTASIQPNDTVWLYPNQELAPRVSRGYDTRYLLSFGPFDISPGQTLPLSFAYIAGENLHKNIDNLDNLPSNPDKYYSNLDFSDLGKNAMWASWIYDNPGVDTDNDGYFGEFRICITNYDTIGYATVVDTTIQGDPPDTIYDTTLAPIYAGTDTIWYEGDGVPDFRGATPPPAPDFWVEPEVGQFRIRFNGMKSENARDIFSHEKDFEGYRIYIARDERSSSYSLLASYDREDYNKYVYNPVLENWELLETPFTFEQLQIIYTDPPLGNPLRYSQSSPYVMTFYPDSIFYFEKQDYNMSDLNSPTGIHKVYPHQPYPSSLDPEEAQPDELTDDGYFKYYEYEYVIEDLLPTVAYWINVTAFDYGSPQSGLKSLETSVTVGSVTAYPLSSAQKATSKHLDVLVYPNPYRLDAGYRTLGYEGRNPGQIDRPDDRVRAIHFANLPPECVISIYSLDGDLIRKIEHDKDPSDPMASHETWDLITRNTQQVVSGLYYWTIESPNRETQIGKLVVIM